jgi:beta-N-acetylhexosaminidase
MLMLGFRGSWVDKGDLIIDAITQRNLGSVVLFDVDVAGGWGQRNIVSPEQLRSLTRKLQSVAAIPLLISMDQEGGQVTRLAERYGFPATQSHATLGAMNDVTATKAASQAMAATLAAMGVNLNLAPVVDVAVNPRNPIIARVERSFSADPAVVAAQAEAFIDGHHAAGVRCTLKHFPGHGSSLRDTHLGFVDVTDTWNDDELDPYRRLIAAGKVDAVMTAHIYNRLWDSEYPATLSPAVIDGMLRQQMGFDGVVISDDLQMRAITDLYSLEKAMELAILAGIDICAVANNVTYSGDVAERFFATVYRMLDAGAITEARIERSYRRILQLKGLQEYQLP